MTTSTQESPIVGIMSFDELMNGGARPLALDDYQRSFVWGPEKIEQLVDDLTEHVKLAGPDVEYYMGTVILHDDAMKGRRFIVDGQQRLTSLCILHYQMMGRLPDGEALEFRSNESVRNIHLAKRRLEELGLGGREASLLDSIRFTVITVDAEDLAFTFFDTQNSRGVPLGATDLHKAFHLRAINGADQHRLQESSARRWERLQRLGGAPASDADFAPLLFNQVLWPARRWTGRDGAWDRSHDRMISEFETDSVPCEEPTGAHIYPSKYNCVGEMVVLRRDDRCEIVPRVDAELGLGTKSPGHVQLPFAMRQPVPRGLGFFLYAENYANMRVALLAEQTSDPEVRAFRKLHGVHLAAGLSSYLQELFLLAAMLHVDRFGSRELFRVALWLDHVLGAIRLEKRYVFKQAAIRFLRDSERNLLDVLASAFRPEDVIGFLRANQWANAVYDKDGIGEEGVQGRYRQGVLRFYGRSGHLKGKAAWITDPFVMEQL